MRDKLILTLNQLLLGELTASNRCLACAELCDEQGYDRLQEAHERRAQQEMAHARALIGQLISLGARPVPAPQAPVPIEPDVAQQIDGELQAAQEAVAGYREGIRLAAEVGDQSARQVLEQILTEELRSLSWLKVQAAELEQLGLQEYLRHQV